MKKTMVEPQADLINSEYSPLKDIYKLSSWIRLSQQVTLSQSELVGSDDGDALEEHVSDSFEIVDRLSDYIDQAETALHSGRE